MLPTNTTFVQSPASDTAEEKTTAIEWPDPDGLDVFEFEDSFEFVKGTLTAKTSVDLSGYDALEPVTGSYTVISDADANTWQSDLVLDTDGEDGPEITMSSNFEVGNEPGARYMSSSFSLTAKSGAGVVDEDASTSGPVVLAFVFDFI